MFLVCMQQNVVTVVLFICVYLHLLNRVSTEEKNVAFNNEKEFYRNRNGTFSGLIMNKESLKISIMEFVQQTMKHFIPNDFFGNYLIKVLLSCSIVYKRTEWTIPVIYSNCCNLLVNDDIKTFYANFCVFCREYWDNSSDLTLKFCKENINNSHLDQYFEIYQQKKRRKLQNKHLEKRAIEERYDSKISNIDTSTNTSNIDQRNTTDFSINSSIHVSKRAINGTGNQTIQSMPDWETILQMQYSKDPQWALVCVVFLVTLILGCVWYSGLCRKRPDDCDDYIDPVITHNLGPEYVKDVVSRKAKFLAWFKYLKTRRKLQQHQQQQKQKTETESLMSGSEDDLFDQTEMETF